MCNTKICYRCGSNKAQHLEHILSSKFISDVNYSQSKYPIVSLTGDGRNLMPVCSQCFNRFNVILIPTLSNIKKDFKYFPTSNLLGYVEYLKENISAITEYVSEMCVYYNEEVKLYQVRMQYMICAKSLREFNELYDRGYFK